MLVISEYDLFMVKSMLVTNVGDQICWRQVWDVDDKSSHQHQDVINIHFVSPLSKRYHRHNLCHIIYVCLESSWYSVNWFGEVHGQTCNKTSDLISSNDSYRWFMWIYFAGGYSHLFFLYVVRYWGEGCISHLMRGLISRFFSTSDFQTHSPAQSKTLTKSKE